MLEPEAEEVLSADNLAVTAVQALTGLTLFVSRVAASQPLAGRAADHGDAVRAAKVYAARNDDQVRLGLVDRARSQFMH
jgi:hypothetical protein